MIYGDELVRMFSDYEDYYIQKQFDENDGPGLGTAMLGGAAALGGGFMMAKKGVFGGEARKWAGKTWAKAGKTLGNSGMIESGMRDAGKGSLTAAGKSYEGFAGKKDLINEMNAISREEGMNVAKVKGQWQYQKGGATKAEAAVEKKAEETAKDKVNNTINSNNNNTNSSNNNNTNSSNQNKGNNQNKNTVNNNQNNSLYDSARPEDQQTFDKMLDKSLFDKGLSGADYARERDIARRTGMIDGQKLLSELSHYSHYKYRYL